MKRIIPLLLAALLLFGCGEEAAGEPAVCDSLVWEETPQLNHGVLEYEKLTVQPWYCGRLEFTGSSKWAETERGFYYFVSGENTLFYADKANMRNWVPVCNHPNCKHGMGSLSCNAHLGGNEFLLRDGRLWYSATTGGRNEVLYLEEGNTAVIASRAFNGTDVRLDYYLEDALVTNGGVISAVLTPSWWMMNVSIFNPDGSYTHRSYRRTESSLELVAEKITQEDTYYLVGSDMRLQGDKTFCNEQLSDLYGYGRKAIYRYVNDVPEKVDNEGCELTGKYLSGNTLRLYKENDGYYDLDLTTRQETKVAEAQLADAMAWVLLPNCILEQNRERMVFFDGETWREVRIPEELRGLDLYPAGAASDRLLLTRYENNGSKAYLYQIMLGQDTLTLELCDRIL